jgi:pSer/pThr/pTyr-binding forkhead associated (FHA) protein
MRGRHHKNDDDEVAVVNSADAVQTGTGSSGAGKWKCLACGAFNEDSAQVCSECTAMRAGAEPASKSPVSSGSEIFDWETPSPAEASTDEPEKASTDTDLSEPPQLEEPQIEPDEEATPQVVSSPIDEPEAPEAPSFTPTFTKAPSPTSAPSYAPSQASGEAHYYLVFVNSPASSIIKSKVSIDFENFPTISIGRNPENVVVIPDQEVSRKHAELSLENGKVIVRDLQSKNGTFVYNGKTFDKVSDSVEVKPNTLLKFGTGTIVRLTTG